jgi:hypothetical protein
VTRRIADLGIAEVSEGIGLVAVVTPGSAIDGASAVAVGVVPASYRRVDVIAVVSERLARGSVDPALGSGLAVTVRIGEQAAEVDVLTTNGSRRLND